MSLNLILIVRLALKIEGGTVIKPFSLIENVFAMTAVHDAVLNLNWMSTLTR